MFGHINKRSMSPAGATYSFSPSVGSGSGSSFSISGTGKITAVRVYEAANAYVSGSVTLPFRMRSI